MAKKARSSGRPSQRRRASARKPPSPARALASLRDDIRKFDAEIMQLVERRLRAAREIGELKARAGLPIRDFHTEKEVRERAAQLGRRLGVERELVESLFSTLIEGSVRVQEEIQETSYEGARKRVLIVGGRGKMGAWLARYFHGQGHAVTTFDPAGRLEGYPSVAVLDAGLASADVVLVATPLESAAATLGEIFARRPRGLVADIFSLKAPVASALHAAVASGLRVASIHPLFGPDAVLLAGRTLLVCDTGDRGAAREVRAFFAPTSLAIHDVSLEAHDRLMAIVLGLSHAASLVFARALRKTGRSFPELREMASTTFWKQAQTASEVAAENPRLYHAIQHENRESEQTLGILLEAAREFVDAALDPDPGAFVSEMERDREWFAFGAPARPPGKSPRRRAPRGQNA